MPLRQLLLCSNHTLLHKVSSIQPRRSLPSYQLLTCCTTRVCMICTHHSSLLHMRFVDLHCTAVRVSTSWLLSQHSSRQSIATPLQFQSPCQSSCNSCWPAALAEVQRQMGPHSKNNNSWVVCNPAPGNTPQGLRSRQQHQTDLHKIVLAAACTALLLQQSASAFCTGCNNSSTASHRPCRRTRDEPSALLSRK